MEFIAPSNARNELVDIGGLRADIQHIAPFVKEALN
jgi:hypothetical protein